MEADTLGIFAQYGVYEANLFSMDCQYQLAAINMFTDYDGKGSSFGDTLVSCQSDDIETSVAYAAINGDSSDTVTLVVTNKSFGETTTANISLDSEYKYAHLYGINSMAAQVFDMTDSNSAVKLNGSSISLEMQPRTVSLLVISKDKPVPEGETSLVISASDSKQEENSSSKLPLIGGIAAGAAALAGGAFLVLRKIRG